MEVAVSKRWAIVQGKGLAYAILFLNLLVEVDLAPVLYAGRFSSNQICPHRKSGCRKIKRIFEVYGHSRMGLNIPIMVGKTRESVFLNGSVKLAGGLPGHSLLYPANQALCGLANLKKISQLNHKTDFLLLYSFMSHALISLAVADMAVWLLVLIAFFGLVSLSAGGEVLTRGAVALAVNCKIDPLVVGLTVVSIATSMPEFSASLMAVEAHPGMALGNILGSNIANTGLILGLAALLSPLRIQMRLFKQEVPILLFVTVLFGLLALGGGFSRLEGGVLLFLVFLYFAYIVRRIRMDDSAVKQTLTEGTVSMGSLSTQVALIAVLVGAVLLALGADVLVQSCAELALRMGVRDDFIGFTVLAVGTSLPELAAAVAAVRAGQGDLCAGNIVGSNLFNLLLIGGGVATLTGIPVEPGLLHFEYFALLFLSLLLLWFFKSGRTVTRREGVCLLFLYFAVVSLSAFGQFDFLP